MEEQHAEISSRRLAELLRLAPQTPSRWHRLGILPGKRRHRRIWFTHETVNALLAKGTRFFHRPVTIDDLLSGRIKLGNYKDIKQLKNLTSPQITSLIRYGRRPCVWLGTDTPRLLLRYPVEVGTVRRTVSVKVVAHVLGISVIRARELLYDRSIEPTETIPFHAYYDSLVAFVKTRLPEWVDAQKWVAERMASEWPLVTFAAATRLLGSEANALGLIQAQKLVCLHGDSGKILAVSPESISSCFASEPIVTTAMLSQLLGVGTETIVSWRRHGLLRCTVHAHSNSEWRRPCALTFLREHLSRNMRPDEWYRQQIDRQRPLLNLTEAATMLNVTPGALEGWSKRGYVAGLCLPNGDWRFTRSHIKTVKMRLKKEAASAAGSR